MKRRNSRKKSIIERRREAIERQRVYLTEHDGAPLTDFDAFPDGS